MEKRKSLLLLFVSLFLALNLSAQGVDKRFSITFHNESLSSALKKIGKISGVRVEFAYDDVNSYKVTTSLKDVTAQQAVKTVIEGKSLSYSVNGRFIVVSKTNKVIVPQRGNQHSLKKSSVVGQVLDSDGSPLVGVTVRIKGTNSGSLTDVDGRFEIAIANSETTLLFTYIGKKDVEVIAKAGHAINITLVDELNQLNDIIVTGYQDIQKTKMTGSATTITAEKLNDRYTPNLLNNLEGRVAGLSTYGGKLTIRGTSSLYAEASPLLVVDGLPIEGKIEDLNPYDIESVNVLKDAAATAIYGARASNGIIVITTKNAKEKNKINIDFTTNLTVYEKKNMDYSDNFYMTPSQQVDVESAYYKYYFFDNDGEISDPISTAQSYIDMGSCFSPIEYAYLQLSKGNITQDQLNSTLSALKQNNYAKEYGDNILRRQVIQQYNLALRSRSDKSSQNLIINYKYDNNGKQNSYKNQFNVNYKGIFNVSNWLTATLFLNGTFGRTKDPSSNYGSNPWSFPAYFSLYDENGDYAWNNIEYGNKYNSYEQNSHYRTMRYNPKEDLTNDVISGRSQNMSYHADLLFKILPELTVNTQFVYETMNASSRQYANANSYAYRMLRNAYTKEVDGKYSYLIPESGGMLKTTNTDGDYWTWRGQINFDKTFNKHSITALAGLEFRDALYKGVNGLLLGYDDQLQNSSSALVNFADLSTMTYSPSFYNGQFYAYTYGYGEYFKDAMTPVTETHHRYSSAYFTATYTYDERYNAFFSFRKDYADVYGLNVKFRGKPLWSVGGAWNINNEPFAKSINWMNYLKLRFSYGVTGNIYQGATSYMTAQTAGNNKYSQLPISIVESPANPELKWEQTRTTDIGLDFSLFNNRLRGNIDYYHKVGKDLFSYKSLDPSKGFTSMFMNMASMKNDGVELQLTYDWLRSNNPSGLNWTTTYTLSYNKNRITSVENDATTASMLIRNPYKVGYPSSALWSYRFAGIDNDVNKGETLWYTSEGNKQHSVSSSGTDALVYSGQSEPKIIMGVDNTLRYRGLSLSILLSYYGGHKMRALAEEETFEVPTSSIPSYFLNAWTPEKPTNTPGIGRYATHTGGLEATYGDIAVRPADFIKIRNIVFGYEIPGNYLSKLGIKHASIHLQIDNPKYLWVKNKMHIDPETLGIRTLSSYIFGLNINI